MNDDRDPRFDHSSPRGRKAAANRRHRAHLSLETLEDRLVPSTFNVNNLADILNPGAGVVTLRSAIQAANATPSGNTINLTLPGTYKITLPGTLGETDNAAGEFVVLPTGGDLTIVNTSGGAVTIDGNHLSRVFDINPNFDPANPTPKFLVTLQGLTVQNGNAFDVNNPDGPTASGGGIRDIGNASLTLTNVVLTNNNATADGGGVVMENVVGVPWTLTVNNSLISNNHAGDAGGGIDEDGMGKVFINAGTVITGNTSVNQGAGIWLDAVGQGPVISVTVNTPGTGYTTAPTVLFTAGGGTGAAATAVISNGMVTAVNITNQGTGYTTPPTITFIGGGGGGATATANLLPVTANLTVTGAVVSGNVAIQGLGGGIGNAGTGTVTILNSTIENNFSGVNGGGFGDENTVGTLVVQNSLFLDNSTIGSGGAIFAGGPTTTITNSEIKGNSAVNGGGLFAYGVTLTVLNTTFTVNTALANGGGFDVETTGTGTAGATITNTTIAGNSALNNAPGSVGGGVDIGNVGGFTGSLTFLNDTINGNFAFSGGGVFVAQVGVINLQNTILAGNQVTNQGHDFVTVNGGQITSLGGNLIGILEPGGLTPLATDQTGTAANPLDPKLGPLGNNGGPAVGAPGGIMTLETEALLTGSPALGKGITAGAPTTDERGLPRVVNGAIDVGALQTQLHPLIVTGADAGGGPEVKVFDAITGALKLDFFAYDPRFTGGVRVALGDVNGDGVPDVITAPGPGGGPDIRVFDGKTGQMIEEFFAYDPRFTGGVYVAAADLDGDGKADIVTAPDFMGGPDVRVFHDGNATGVPNQELFAYDPHFLGGVRIAIANIDGHPDIITAPGFFGGPDVRIFDPSLGGIPLVGEFMAYNANFLGGVYVAAGDVNGDGVADIITAPGGGMAPEVKVFNGKDGTVLDDFFAYNQAFTGGVRVAFVADVNGDGKGDIVTAPGQNGGPDVRVFDGATAAQLEEFFAYDPHFLGGVFVGGQ